MDRLAAGNARLRIGAVGAIGAGAKAIGAHIKLLDARVCDRQGARGIRELEGAVGYERAVNVVCGGVVAGVADRAPEARRSKRDTLTLRVSPGTDGAGRVCQQQCGHVDRRVDSLGLGRRSNLDTGRRILQNKKERRKKNVCLENNFSFSLFPLSYLDSSCSRPRRCSWHCWLSTSIGRGQTQESPSGRCR